MDTFFHDFLNRLQRLHDEMESTLAGLPSEALDWMPGHGTNSLAVLVVHVAGAERYWMGDVVAGELSGRDRDAEFGTHGLDASQLLQRLRDSLVYCRQVLDRLRLEDLSTVCVSPRDGREFTVGWSLAHVLEHTAIHLGHMQMTRQLWGQRGK